MQVYFLDYGSQAQEHLQCQGVIRAPHVWRAVQTPLPRQLLQRGLECDIGILPLHIVFERAEIRALST